ncbi:hypothetical protein PMI01_04762 [Caulobacter sp. AP07]|nr:hypothetical protein PMI01_04762 [Caulobacter sp. AP07]
MGAASSFKQRDVTRAFRAAHAAGVRAHVWIDHQGSLHIQEAAPLTELAPEALPSNDRNPWDDLLT